MIVSDSAGWLFPIGALVAAFVVVAVMLTIRRRRVIALVVSIVAIFGGIAGATLSPISFGWFAYAPLSDSFFPIDFWIPRLGGLLVAGSGLFGIGVVVGSARSGSAPPT